MTLFERGGTAVRPPHPTVRTHTSAMAAGLLAGLCAMAMCVAGSARAETIDASVDAPTGPTLSVETTLGTIDIELFDDAAPIAVRRLTSLAAGSDSEPGYFDGIGFDYTKPRLEIRTQAHPSLSPELPVEIDAGALGLDATAAGTAGEAMNILQNELMAAFRKDKHGERLTPQMTDWLDTWYDTRDAGFLVGVSRRQINEALGYAYTDGLPSQPVTAGSVALVPAGPTMATARLSIALRDMPRRTGRWMVVGRVVGGLDVAERISLEPLEQPRDIKPRRYAPRNPVTIESVLLTPPTNR